MLEAAPWSSATPCLPAPGTAQPQGVVRALRPGPPAFTQPLASIQFGGMREANPHIAFPCLPVLPSPGTVSVCPSDHRTVCSVCSPAGGTSPRSRPAVPGRPGAAEAAPRLCPGLARAPITVPAVMCHPQECQNHLQAVPIHTKPSLRKEQDLPGGKGRSLTLPCPTCSKVGISQCLATPWCPPKLWGHSWCYSPWQKGCGTSCSSPNPQSTCPKLATSTMGPPDLTAVLLYHLGPT